MQWSDIVLREMSGPENRSLIKLPGSELVMSDPAAEKVLPRMVNESLATVRTALADAEVLLQEGKNHFWGEGIPRNYSEAFVLFSKAAAAGNPEAHFWVGRCYENGHGIGMDDARAVEWYQKSADLGSADGMFALGELYRDGRSSLSHDSSKAFAFFQRAAEQGLADAQYELGCWYQSGGEVAAMDWAEAARWFRRAAEQGFEDAQEELGFCYFHGRGVERDYAEAVKWLRAAAPGNSASHVLAHCYVQGLGVQHDLGEAVNLSLDSGRNPAWLGFQYISGEWPWPQNDPLAYMWLRNADARDKVDWYGMQLLPSTELSAREYLRALVPRMSPHDLWVGEALLCKMSNDKRWSGSWGHKGSLELKFLHEAYRRFAPPSVSGGKLDQHIKSLASDKKWTDELRRFLDRLFKP